MRKPYLRGSRVSKSHSSVIEQAREFLTYVHSIPAISKIVISIIEHTGTSSKPVPMKIITVEAGLQVKIRGNSYVQTFYLYTSDKEDTMKILEEWEEGKKRNDRSS